MNKRLTWTDRLRIEQGLREGWINSYPRAVLSYLSADDLFGAYLASIFPTKKFF